MDEKEKNWHGSIKVSTATVVKALIKGLKIILLKIRVPVVKMLYYLNRFLLSVAYKMLNK